ncbi:MAG TPA: hypothetical protein VJ063_11665 [Verrucomicrobiae bacterium]|nr:hypothetical protein [Verrucomicrobiae bacterium]
MILKAAWRPLPACFIINKYVIAFRGDCKADDYLHLGKNDAKDHLGVAQTFLILVLALYAERIKKAVSATLDGVSLKQK